MLISELVVVFNLSISVYCLFLFLDFDLDLLICVIHKAQSRPQVVQGFRLVLIEDIA